ncbi:hypothetical protein jhhlp_007637 [Lomentospora prolificans]|uniref:AHC1-like C2H2 zinc-finger domain-containing protein n=1 Tax=Lomentospora prolificans TaxID=41688 RepID=A0A2N3N050_9PEZI|nr:hypothetical protein jhhlp_007637 [Lomentospora prolificans]
MSMFRFWGSESRGGDQSIKIDRPMIHSFPTPSLHSIHPPIATPGAGAFAAPLPLKRERDVVIQDDVPAAKRPKQAETEQPAMNAPSADHDKVDTMNASENRQEKVRDLVQFHFGLEILHKHDELRLIDQELAKCQIALEQLRRCHLIPYPINCPTPDQMVEIASGKGAALRKPGKEVPRWAPPFGVTDGPYARHYAKWLIPDPMFDGMLPEWQSPYDMRSSRVSAEGRTTRNSAGDVSLGSKQRPVRGNAGQKLQSLMGGYPTPKEKNGPCTLKRQSDGQIVKLVCLDCHRENFLSIQGFINHCRIAHRRDFKSHEEAAIHSGHVIETNDAAKTPTPAKPVVEELKQPTPPAVSTTAVHPSPSGLVHPYAQNDMSRQEAFSNLQRRIQESLRLYQQGKHPNAAEIPAVVKPDSSGAPLVPAPDAPYLSRLMKAKQFTGDLQRLVSEAKADIFEDELSSPGYDMDESETPTSVSPTTTPQVLRMPAITRPTSKIGPPSVLPLATPTSRKPGETDVVIIRDEDDDMDMDPDLSPNPSASNNAPSLVSDDGEYDESDDGSSESGASDNLEAESLSDVADIAMDDYAPKSLRHHGESSASAVPLRKENKKAVTLVSPVKNTGDRRGARNV